VITQLREMGSAGQSTKVAVKNHQKPISFVVVEMDHLPITVATVERNGWFSCKVFHGSQFLKQFARLE